MVIAAWSEDQHQITSRVPAPALKRLRGNPSPCHGPCEARSTPRLRIRQRWYVRRNATDRWLVGWAIQMYCVLYTDTHKEAGMSETKVRGRRSTTNVRRKNLNIDQAKLDRVRELLGADTETQAVDLALSALLLREELIAGVRRVAGSGGVENVFEGDVEP